MPRHAPRNPFRAPSPEPRCTEHAQLHLPPLTPHEALLFVRILEKLSHAIWRAHGVGMAELLRREIDAHLQRSPKARNAHLALEEERNRIKADHDLPF